MSEASSMSGPMSPNGLIGRVVAVAGSRVTVLLAAGDGHAVEVGSIARVHTNRSTAFGLVSSLRTGELPAGAGSAATAQPQEGHQRNILQRADGVATGRAARAGPRQAERVVSACRLAAQLSTLRGPFAFHHKRQSVDHHIQERADTQPQHEGEPRVGAALDQPVERFGAKGWHGAGGPGQCAQTASPSLKIGRYMAITMPPISVPSTTMIIGSIRDESASTASSTSAS